MTNYTLHELLEKQAVATRSLFQTEEKNLDMVIEYLNVVYELVYRHMKQMGRKAKKRKMTVTLAMKLRSIYGDGFKQEMVG